MFKHMFFLYHIVLLIIALLLLPPLITMDALQYLY